MTSTLSITSRRSAPESDEQQQKLPIRRAAGIAAECTLSATLRCMRVDADDHHSMQRACMRQGDRRSLTTGIPSERAAEDAEGLWRASPSHGTCSDYPKSWHRCDATGNDTGPECRAIPIKHESCATKATVTTTINHKSTFSSHQNRLSDGAPNRSEHADEETGSKWAVQRIWKNITMRPSNGWRSANGSKAKSQTRGRRLGARRAPRHAAARARRARSE